MNTTEAKTKKPVQQNVELLSTGKTCNKCKKIKNKSDFHKQSSNKDGLRNDCKLCRSKSRSKTDLSKLANKTKDGYIFCRKCCIEKKANSDNFYASKLSQGSKVLTCKPCRDKFSYMMQDKEQQKDRHKKWRDKNKEKISTYKKNYVKNNKDKIKTKDKEYRSRTEVKKARRLYERKYYQENRNKLIAYSCAYDSRVRASRPSWQSQKEINNYYKKAKENGLEVDHIVPIKSDLVCGLHCIDNFQLLTRSENASKGNRHWPDMP